MLQKGDFTQTVSHAQNGNQLCPPQVMCCLYLHLYVCVQSHSVVSKSLQPYGL